VTTGPTAVAADKAGRIADIPGLGAAGRSGRTVYPLDAASLIPLPQGSRLYLLPGRRAVGFDGNGEISCAGKRFAAVAAFLPPGYVAFSLAAFIREPRARVLPLYCYCAVCWHRGRFCVPAARVDHDSKHDPCRFDAAEVRRQVTRRLKESPGNRLMAHHGRVCALRYGCPNAANLFLRRWEAPIAVAGGCNAVCRGCISKQDSDSNPSPQERIGFTPTVEEIVEIAVPHLERAPRAMISFGQGCEGEPLLQGRLIEDAIREIRRRTGRGAIHLNTNGSKPRVVERLAAAGLNSIRISLNSAREPLYAAYYRCRGYSMRDVLDSFKVARKGGLWVSVNYLTFPGVTDSEAEFAALSSLLSSAKPDMIQWRNLNIDPDVYMDAVEEALAAGPPAAANGMQEMMGIPSLLRLVEKKFPRVRTGYFNPAVRPARS